MRSASARHRRQGGSGPPGLRFRDRRRRQRLDRRHGQSFPHGGEHVKVVPPHEKLPKLPVARALWEPEPNLAVAAAAWIYAGGAHHTGFSLALTPEYLEDFAEMAGIEFLLIDGDTKLRQFRNELRVNEAAYA